MVRMHSKWWPVARSVCDLVRVVCSWFRFCSAQVEMCPVWPLFLGVPAWFNSAVQVEMFLVRFGPPMFWSDSVRFGSVRCGSRWFRFGSVRVAMIPVRFGSVRQRSGL